MFVKLHSEKAASPIEVTVLGIIVLLQPFINVLVDVLIIALQLFLESYVVLLLSTVIFVRPVRLKAKLPIEVILSGIITLVKLLQSRKASTPIFVTLFGIIIFVKLLQL